MKRKRRHLSPIVAIFTLIALLISFFLPETLELPTSDKPVALYSNQKHQDLTDLFVSSINQAKESVSLVIYTLTDPKILEALKRKADEGVKVFVVYDGKATGNLTKKLGNRITMVRRHVQWLTHQKVMVIDHRLLIAGSANYTTASLKYHGNLVMAIDHPQLARIFESYIHDYTKTGKMPGMSTPFIAGGESGELWITPNEPAAQQRILSLIRTAKKTIRVAMFTWTRLDFADAIKEAKERGVDVEVAIDRQSAAGVSGRVVERLQQGDVSVFLSRGQALLHYKFVWIDDKTLAAGSANWTQAGFSKNDDFFIILKDLPNEWVEYMQDLWRAIISHADRQKNAIRVSIVEEKL